MVASVAAQHEQRASCAGSAAMLTTRHRSTTSPAVAHRYSINAGLKGGVGAFVAQGLAAGEAGPSRVTFHQEATLNTRSAAQQHMLQQLQHTLSARAGAAPCRRPHLGPHAGGALEPRASRHQQTRPPFSPHVRCRPYFSSPAACALFGLPWTRGNSA